MENSMILKSNKRCSTRHPPIQPMKVNTQTNSTGDFNISIKAPSKAGIIKISTIFEGDNKTYGTSVPRACVY